MTAGQSFLNKKYLLAGLIAILILPAAGFLYSYFDAQVEVFSSGKVIYADTVSSVFFKVSYRNRLRRLFLSQGPAFEVEKRGGPEVKIITARDGFYVKGAQETGKVLLSVKTGAADIACSVEAAYTAADTDGDGFPDVAEISSRQDRNSFIRWFVTIAQSQFYTPSRTWYNVHRDCAGLIVFAYKEALKKHDSKWYKGFSYLIEADISDVQQYNYPYVPLLGDTIFRTAAGPFKESDLEAGLFAPSCNVSNLLNFNMQFISRDVDVMQKGDVLFYRVADNPAMPFHSMIYTGEYLVYHTGPVSNDGESETEGENARGTGEVRMLKPEHLFLHPDKVWHPARDNPAFLGVYRFNIISG